MIGKLHFRRGLVAVATLLFAGCSALQVSVDVYKGPLVSEDSMLRQQAIAMALGAKPLMARLRASLVAHDRETRGLGTHQGELRRLEKTYGSTAVGFEGTIDWPPEARYLDGALSMYADLDSASCYVDESSFASVRSMPVSVVGPSSPPSFADRLNAANTNFRAAITSGDDQSVIDALRSLWELAVVIGEIGARSAFAKPTPEAAIAQKRLLDDIAGLLAKLNSALSTGSADSNNVGISTSPVFRNNADIRISLTNSVNDLKRLAQNKRADEAIDVRDVLKTFSAIQTQSSRVLSSLASEQMRSVRLNLDSETVRGVESSARNSADSARLALPGPFDSGRPCNGIDSLATRLAQMPSISEADQAKREQWETQLDTLLISLGERLRFIATNGWLASESVPVKAGGASDSRRPDESQADSVSSASQELDLGSPEGRTKALLETVGNTLLVFADDEFRRDAHAKREADGRSRESGAFEALMRFDAGGAFAEIVRRIEAEISRVSQAAGPEGAPTAAKPSDQALRDAQSVLSHWLALAVVLDKQALVTHRATIDELWAGFSVDIESVLTRVRGSLSQGNANPSLETLGQALTHETKLWSAGGLARPDAQAALTGLGSLIENLGQRTVADRTLTYAELRSRVKGDVKLAFERWTQAKKAFDLAKAADEEAAVAANTNAQTRQRAQSLVDALNAVRGAKTVFEQRMKAAMSVVSVGQAYDMVLDIVEKSQPVSDSSSARLAALRNVRASVVGGNDGMPFVVGGETRRIEVLDAYIARLRYRYLDALERRSDGVGDVEHALAAAYRMRAEMVHVRPASAYLRAMFTATGLQQDPQLRNDNMLNDTLGRLWGAPFKTSEGAKKFVNLESLDKAYWQRVNTLRLDGAASTNYVVAKDDLGNWMVKSVGTNVAGIAKTALNLAMFNLGQRVDTNFLRAQQIRLELDDPELDPGRRSALEGELKAAQISAAGGIGKQGDLAKDLKSAFDVDALAAHESLRAALTGFRPGRELALIWMQSLDGSSAKAASDWRTRVAQPTTQGPAVLREAYQRVLTKVQITPANAWEANEAILTSLRALDEYRRELRLAVRADEALVADESTRLQLAKAELARLEALAAASQPSGTPTAGVGAPPAPTPGASTPSTGNAAAAPVAAQPTGAAVPAAGTGSAAADFEAAKAQVKLAQTALDDARQRREAAAKETDAIFLAEMKKVVGTRISALERHRTAFDAFGGQGAKQSTTKEADAK